MSVKIDRPIFALACGLILQKRLLVLVASRAGEFAKPWKSEGSALALPSVIQHSPCDKYSTGGAFDPPTQRKINTKHVLLKHRASVLRVLLNAVCGRETITHEAQPSALSILETANRVQ